MKLGAEERDGFGRRLLTEVVVGAEGERAHPIARSDLVVDARLVVPVGEQRLEVENTESKPAAYE